MKQLLEDIKHPFAGLFIDGHNEHGYHLIWLSDWNMEGVDFDDMLESKGAMAKQIFDEAAAAGFSENSAVVTLWRLIDIDFGAEYWEYIGLSIPLTHAIYGTVEEQAAEISRAKALYVEEWQRAADFFAEDGND